MEEKPFWRPRLDNRSPNDIVGNIIEMQKKVNDFKEQSDSVVFLEGYKEYHFSNYVVLTLKAESDTDLTIEQVDEWKSDLINSKKTTPNERLRTKALNIHKLLQKLFPSLSEQKIQEFDPRFICCAHRTIMAELMDSAGEYRKKLVGPNKENRIYLAPHLIEKQLLILCQEVQTKWGAIQSTDPPEFVKSAVKLAAYFLARFLFIHPFMNGNGRTARILTSMLLSPISIVPLHLYTNRDDYLQVLREAQFAQDISYSPIATLVLECVSEGLLNMCQALDI